MKTTPLFLSALLLLSTTLHAQTTASWTAGSGNWSLGTNWNTGTAPINGLPLPGDTYNAVINPGSPNTVTLDVPVTVQDLTFASGKLAGSNVLNVSGVMTWSGNEINGTNAATDIVNVTGALVLDTTTTKTMNTRTLNIGDDVNAINAQWTGGTLDLRSNSVINNRAGSIFTSQFDGTIDNGANNTSTFNNEGTFTKSAGTGMTLVDNSVVFNNSGTVFVKTGTIRLDGNGTHSGRFNTFPGTTLDLNASSHILNAGTFFDGSGTLEISTLVTANAAVSISSGLNLNAGTMNGAGTYDVSGPMSWSGGTISGTNAAAHIVNATGGVTFSGSGIKSLYTRTLNIGDGVSATTASWSGGTLDLRTGAVINNTANSTFNTSFDGLIDNGANDSGTFNNAGIFNKTAGTGTTSTDNTITFINSGTVNVNSGTVQFNGTLTNSGSIDANNNTVVINGGGSGAGSFNADAGGLVDFTGGTYALNAGGALNGVGIYRLSGVGNPTLTIAGTVSMAHLDISSGTLNGGGAVSASGGLAWSGGTMSGAGSTTAGSISSISGSGTKTLSSRALVYQGAGTQVTWTGTGNIQSDGSITVQNGAVFNIQNNQTMGDGNNNTVSGTLVVGDGGTLRKSAGTGTSTIGGALGFGGDTVIASVGSTGTVEVQSGTLAFANAPTNHSGSTLTGGNWNVSNGATLAFNAGSNITTNAANVTLDGAGSTFAKLTSALNNNQGSLTLKNDRDLTTAGAYANSGTTRVEGGSTVLTVGAGGGAAYTQSIGETVLVGGALIDASVFNLNGGDLKGTGTIASSVITSGSTTIAPGQSPGMLTIDGDLTLSAGNTLAMEIGGLGQGTDYDYIDVAGTLTLAGLLDLDLINGFESSITNGNLFTLVTSASDILGAFSNVASGDRLSTSDLLGSFAVYYGAGSPYGGSSLVIGDYSSVPEPSRTMLLIAGLMAMVMQRRRLPGSVTGLSSPVV